MEVGEKLQKLLAELNLPGYIIAEQLGVSESTVSRWLDGSRFPSASNLFMLAKVNPHMLTKDEIIKWLSKK